MNNFQIFLDALEEFSSYYTRDSFRAPVLNTYDRCLEIQRVRDEISVGHLREGVLSWMIKELKYSVEHDEVLKAFYCQEVEDFLSLIGDSQLEVKLFSIDRLYGSIKNGYFKKCRNLVKKLALENLSRSDKQGKLVHLTGTFYSLLINAGHTQEEVYRQVNNSRKTLNSASSSRRALDNFFSFFPCRATNYTAYVRADEHLAVALQGGNIENVVGSVPASIYRRHKKHLNPSSSAQPVFKISNVRAFDLGDARQRVEERLKFARAISYTQRHDMDSSWGEYMVIHGENEVPLAIPKPLSPMQSRRRISRIHSEKVIAERARKLSETEQDAKVRSAIENSILEYANAFHADSPATQLVSVWSALEGICPQIEGEDGRIGQITEVVRVAQELYYPRNLIQWNFESHYAVNSTQFLKILEGHPGSKDFLKKFASIVIRHDSKSASESLKGLAASRPLTQYRCYQAITKLKAGGELLKSISDHSNRVDWQVRRIYLERNRIVHRANPSRNQGNRVWN